MKMEVIGYKSKIVKSKVSSQWRFAHYLEFWHQGVSSNAEQKNHTYDYLKSNNKFASKCLATNILWLYSRCVIIHYLVFLQMSDN